jgi:protein-S-isoprenylcysteine O-methyltransferase Ste14
MPSAVRSARIGLSLTFLAVGMYHRIRAAHSGDRLDHTREGWPTLIALKLAGFMTFGSTAAWLWNPLWFAWAAFPVADSVRWMGVAAFALSITWLIWMFISLGPNLTDTVTTRRNAQFVDRGPYRYVRNPMYWGILMIGPSLGLALGTWLLPLAAAVMFAILARRARLEEMYLIAHFGDQYRTYMTRVGRFFPRLN